MCKRIWGALVVLMVAGGFYVVGAQQNTAPQKKEGYVPYVYTAKWYGFVTDNLDIGQGYKATAEAIRKNVAEKGARYMLYNAHEGRVALDSPEKVAPFAGQRVFVYGSISSTVYGSGPTASDEVTNNGGFASPEPRNITTIKVTSIVATDLKDTYDRYVAK